MSGTRRAARRLWESVEPIHAVVYFAPEAKATYERAGLKGYWMGYFASRSAAMGPVPPEVVTATFYNFHPAMVRRAIPDAWSFSSTSRVLKARRDLASEALSRIDLDATLVDRARSLLWEALEDCNIAGRTLFAGHVSLPRSNDPLLDLWHACTCWREHRGDGHVAALLREGIDGCEANVLAVAAGHAPGDQRRFRGWSDDAWDAATRRLRERDLLDDDDALTDEGRALKSGIEDRTDALSVPPLP